MNISRQEIADVAMVSKNAVDKAISRGTLNEASLSSIFGFVLAKRATSGGIQAVTGLCPEGRESPLTYEETGVYKQITVKPDFIPTHHDYETSDEEFKHEG